jgi:hypothetical protein
MGMNEKGVYADSFQQPLSKNEGGRFKRQEMW